MSSLFLSLTVSLTGMMALLTFVVLLIIIFFKTPYKRLEAESASNPDISNASSSHSLTATSGYNSEVISRNNTTASNSSKTQVTVLGKDEAKETAATEEDSDVEQCRL